MLKIKKYERPGPKDINQATPATKNFLVRPGVGHWLRDL